jgi:DNA (cytosine-5)-methyltransferase 1
MRVLSLFSGAGGMDLGFKQAGHEIVWANDFDADASETYRRNIGDHIVQGDIREIDISEVPDADIVIGGFPCQGFSRANMLRSTNDDRNTLYLEFLRVIRLKQPKYFVAENVSGILSLDGGNVIKQIVHDFERAGFNVEYRLLNLADFGVPQSRRRVIFLGWRKDIDSRQRPQFPPETHSSKPCSNQKPWVTIGYVLKNIPEPSASHSLKNHVCSQYKVSIRDFTGHRKTDPSKPSPTILARGNGKGGVCAIHHPNSLRRLSVRESALIQTFPKNFVFCGGLNSMYRQVGNAVPVRFAFQLAKQLMKAENATCAQR